MKNDESSRTNRVDQRQSLIVNAISARRLCPPPPLASSCSRDTLQSSISLDRTDLLSSQCRIHSRRPNPPKHRGNKQRQRQAASLASERRSATRSINSRASFDNSNQSAIISSLHSMQTNCCVDRSICRIINQHIRTATMTHFTINPTKNRNSVFRRDAVSHVKCCNASICSRRPTTLCDNTNAVFIC